MHAQARRPLRSLTLGLLLLLATAGMQACAGTSFAVRSLPDWSRANHRISVFGVKRDGLMSRDGWHALGPEMPTPFGASACDVAFSQSTFAQSPALAQAVDGYVRSNGVTDALLTQLAPAAKGDAIMLVTVSGTPQRRADGGPNTAAAMGSGARGGRGMGGGGGGGGGRRGRGGMRQASGPEPSESGDGFHVSASFYDVHAHRSVAMFEMHYLGTRADEAVREFNQRLETDFPGARCQGWDWSAAVDAASIATLHEE